MTFFVGNRGLRRRGGFRLRFGLFLKIHRPLHKNLGLVSGHLGCLKLRVDAALYLGEISIQDVSLEFHERAVTLIRG